MAANLPAVTMDGRIAEILDALQDIAAGDLQRRVAISAAHDEIDAIAHTVNVVGGELDYATRKLSRAREEAETASEAKTTFLRNVSHELRTPLSAILGAAQLLQRPGLSAARREELHARIIANVRAQVDLLNDLLDLSQVESGKLAIEMRPTAVTGILQDVVASLEPAAAGKGLQLMAVHPTGDVLILGDGRRLRQILVNVIGNAIKFTSGGRIVARAGREGRDVIIDVADTGLGIDAAYVDRLFEPFSQAEPSIGPRFGGSGLGLALARRLARGMAGELALLESAPGNGATFRLRLPEWQAAGATDATGPAGAPPPPRPALHGVRVLLADDHDDIRTTLTTLLELSGASVVEAASGGEAVVAGARGGIDVILMDVRMPDIDGLEASRRLRAMGVRTPIVALTADIVARRHEYADAGCTTQLAKPVDSERLIGVIHALATGQPDVAAPAPDREGR